MLAVNKNSLAIPDGLSEQPSKQQEVVVTKFQKPLSQHVPALPKVAIPLCAYHGQQYLADQMDSFVTQNFLSGIFGASGDSLREIPMSA
jgi:hypothetical protein